MREVFLDTVGLLAVWDDADQWHAAADEVYVRLLQEKCRLITTSQVLLECGNAAARRPYRKRLNALRQAFEKRQLIVNPTVEEIEQAWIAFDSGLAGQAGIVDQISFAVMRRCQIVEAFTNDRHFAAAGFVAMF